MGADNGHNMHFTINKKTMMGAKLAAWIWGLIDLTGIGLFLHTWVANIDNWKGGISFSIFVMWSAVSAISKWEDIKKKRIENDEREFDLLIKKRKYYDQDNNSFDSA